MKYKLVIWDFDGVIADSEKIYIENRKNYINKKFGLHWNIQTTINYLGGLSDFSNREVLNKLGYYTTDDFWSDLVNIDKEKMCHGGLKAVKGIENLIKIIPKQCIATSGTLEKTIFKLELIHFWHKYFNEQNLFTGDMVKKGKPEPDVFLLAAQKMNVEPKDCIIVEDSIAGLTAAQKAGMNVIAFLGCDMYLNNVEYLNKVKELGIKNIYYNVQDIKQILMR